MTVSHQELVRHLLTDCNAAMWPSEAISISSGRGIERYTKSWLIHAAIGFIGWERRAGHIVHIPGSIEEGPSSANGLDAEAQIVHRSNPGNLLAAT